jgi:arylsulfatase A-like enzyme
MKPMGFSSYHVTLMCVTGLALTACKDKTEPVTAPRPNIIIILADDLGYGGIGCYGNTSIKTPNINALAADGIKFTDFHSNGSVCTPTRAALLTGKYQQRSGLEGVIYVKGDTRKVGLDSSQVTVAELLKDNGYATGVMGKWHLGYRKEFNPVHHGFDEFYGYLSGNIDYHSHYDNAGIYDWWHNLDSISEKGYSTDLITDHSVDFIDKNRGRPFFLYISHEAPHVPFQGRNDPAYRFPDKEFSYYGPVDDRISTYKEMVEVMDEGVGKVMEALRRNGLEENTLVFFLSDNGAEEFGDNGGLNGDKISLLEGGHRVPAIAYWKSKIEPRVSSEILISMDLAPTVLSLAGLKIPKETEFDGIDVSNTLLNESPIGQRTLFWRYLDQKAVRENQWKLLINEKDTLLFDMEEDIAENSDLSDSHKNILHDLVDKLGVWESDIKSQEAMKTK